MVRGSARRLRDAGIRQCEVISRHGGKKKASEQKHIHHNHFAFPDACIARPRAPRHSAMQAAAEASPNIRNASPSSRRRFPTCHGLASDTPGSVPDPTSCLGMSSARSVRSPFDSARPRPSSQRQLPNKVRAQAVPLFEAPAVLRLPQAPARGPCTARAASDQATRGLPDHFCVDLTTSRPSDTACSARNSGGYMPVLRLRDAVRDPAASTAAEVVD